MEQKLLKEVLACFKDERMVYYYFKDKYCLFLLEQFIGEGKTINELKQSHLSQICTKPLIKQWLSGVGGKYIDILKIQELWPTDVESFSLSLDEWGGDCPSCQQTCRRGYNLVLQLNFTKSHDRFYEKIADSDYEPFCFYSHPVHKGNRNTLAWSRIDISDDFSEALIEEIQTDWLREVESIYQDIQKNDDLDEYEYHGIKPRKSLFESYVSSMQAFKKLWDEAMLTASLEFLVDKVGVKNVYYYDFETGCKLKHLNYGKPPKSLYTKLPKRFGFKKTSQAPDFIANDYFVRRKMKKLKIEDQSWFQMQF